MSEAVNYDQVSSELLQFYDAAGNEAQSKYGPKNPNVDYLQAFHNEKVKARAALINARSPEALGSAIEKLSKSMEKTAKASSPQTYQYYLEYVAELKERLKGKVDIDDPVLKALDDAEDRANPWYSNVWLWVGLGAGGFFIYSYLTRGDD